MRQRRIAVAPRGEGTGRGMEGGVVCTEEDKAGTVSAARADQLRRVVNYGGKTGVVGGMLNISAG